MNKELSEAVFQNRLTKLPGNILTYVDYKENSDTDVIILHQHLGLQNYVRVIGQALINNKYSIIFPNLFGQSDEDEEDNLAYLQKLDHKKIAETALSVVNYVAKRKNRIVLMGFSIGAAVGLKILEYTNKVDFGFFFYGLPPLETVNPYKITASVTIFLGSDDKIKHLSDRLIARRVGTLYHKNKNIQIMDLQGGKHGFVNAASEAYDEKLFQICCDRIHQKIGIPIDKIRYSQSIKTRKSEATERQLQKQKARQLNESKLSKTKIGTQKENRIKQTQKEAIKETKLKQTKKKQVQEKKQEKQPQKEDEGGCHIM